MYTIRRNHTIIEVLTVLIYAENRNMLWEYRNLIQKIESMVSCKLDLSLTARPHTVMDILKFDTNAVDIYLIDTDTDGEIDKHLERQIRKKYPLCRGLRKENIGYAYSDKTANAICRNTPIHVEEAELEDFLLQLVGENLTKLNTATL